jgi:hypothetical protein
MAIDYTGMFTGKRPDPSAGVAGMPRDLLGQTLQGIQQGEQRARQGLGSLFNIDLSSPAEKAKKELSGLDINSPDYKARMLEIINKADPLAAAALRSSNGAGNANIGKINPQTYSAKSIQEFNRHFQQTGQQDYSLLKEIDQVSEAFKVGQMTDIRAGMKKRSESLMSAANIKIKTNTMKELLDSGLTTGTLAGLSKSAKGFAQSLFPDVEFKGLKEAEVFNALGSQLALLVRNPASDMGLPGATSNKDLAFLIDTVPGLSKSVEGNKLLLEVYDKQFEFKKNVASEQARLMKENNGVPPIDMEERLTAYAISLDVLGDDLRNRLQTKAESEDLTYDEKEFERLLALDAETVESTGTSRRQRRAN